MIFDKIYSLQNAYVIPAILMVIGSGWQLETKVKWKKRLYFIYSFLVQANLYSIAVVDIIVIIKVWGNFHDLMETLCIFVLGICTLLKHHIITTKVSILKEIENELDNNLSCIKLSPVCEEEQKKLIKAREVMMVIFKSLTISSFPSIGMQLVYPVLDEPERKRLPAPFWLPIDMKTSPNYEIIYTYLCITSVSFCSMALGIDSLFYGILVRINAQFELLHLQFQKLGKYIRAEIPVVDNYNLEHVKDKRKYIKLTLHKSFRYHQAILREIDKMMDIFSWSLFIHMTAVSVQICIVVVDLIKTKDNKFTAQQVQRIPFLAIILIDTWIFCLFGTWIENQSVSLAEEAGGLPWYDMDIPARRALLFFITRTQKGCPLTAGHSIRVNLAYFLSILNASYSFYSVVRHTMK